MSLPGVIRSPNTWTSPRVYGIENRRVNPDRVIEAAMAEGRTWDGTAALDVGCGSGFHLPRFAATAGLVIGVEPHPPLVARPGGGPPAYGDVPSHDQRHCGWNRTQSCAIHLSVTSSEQHQTFRQSHWALLPNSDLDGKEFSRDSSHMATIHFHGSQQMAAQADDRAQPPIRWPHPNRYSVLTIALWGLGLIVALLIPASIVPPGQKTASVADVWTAFSFTVLGALIMMGATGWRYRTTRDSGILVLGTVPGASVIIGGVILATVKVLGFV